MRFVLVGTGGISTTWIKAVNTTPGSSVVACVSRSGRKPDSLPDIPCAANLSAINVPFDAAIILLPNGLHHQSAVEAARLGKHVVCEKPLDVSRASMDQMINACTKAGVTLAVSFQHRAASDNQTLKNLVATNALGTIYAVNVSCCFWRPQAYYDSATYRGGWAIDGGGVFMQQAIHQIDLYQWLFGLPQTVKAELGTFGHQMEAEDQGSAIFKHKNGMIGTFSASTAWNPGFPPRIDICCQKGSLSLVGDRIDTWNIAGLPNPSAFQGSRQPEEAPLATVADASLHALIIKDFVSAVEQGREPFVTAESARDSTELVLRIYEAARPADRLHLRRRQ